MVKLHSQKSYAQSQRCGCGNACLVNRTKGPSTAVGVFPPLLWQNRHLLTSSSIPPILSACADTQHPFPTSSLEPDWQPENPWAPGSIFPVVLFCLYLYFMISHLEGKTERAIFFFASALQGVEQILNSIKWSCQGLKSFSGSNHLSVYSDGRTGEVISFPVSRILSYLGSVGEGKRKNRKCQKWGRLMSMDHFFAAILQHWHILSWPETCKVEEEFPWPHSTFSLIIAPCICIILFILHSGVASISSSYSLRIPVKFVG